MKAHRGNPLDRSDEGVFVSKINSGGAAKRDGRLKVRIVRKILLNQQIVFVCHLKFQ
jgi:protein scribble